MKLPSFEVTHNDGTCVIVKATNEDMARQFAMQKKWGPASANTTFPVDGNWKGYGLSVKEVAIGIHKPEEV